MRHISEPVVVVIGHLKIIDVVVEESFDRFMDNTNQSHTRLFRKVRVANIDHNFLARVSKGLFVEESWVGHLKHSSWGEIQYFLRLDHGRLPQWSLHDFAKAFLVVDLGTPSIPTLSRLSSNGR